MMKYMVYCIAVIFFGLLQTGLTAEADERNGTELMIGDEIEMKVEEWKDEWTGRTVQRLGAEGLRTNLPYFTRECVLPDNSGILMSVLWEDEWRLFAAYPDTGKMKLLSDQVVRSATDPCIGGERILFFNGDNTLGYIPLEGGEFTAVAQPPDDCSSPNPAISSDGRYAVYAWFEKRKETTKSLLRDGYPSRGSENNFAIQSGVVVHIDLDTGITKGIGGGNHIGGHPMINPTNSFNVEVCKDTSWRDQRMWTIQYYQEANYTTQEPLYVQESGYEAVGHEAFLQDGRVVAVYQKYKNLSDAPEDTEYSAILVADPKTGKSVKYRTPGFVWNHIHGRDGKTFVSEGRSDLHLPPDKHESVMKSELGRRSQRELNLVTRYDVAGRKTEATPLCVTGTSWKDGNTHPHPVLDREHKWCYFRSDRSGVPQVYRVDMRKE